MQDAEGFLAAAGCASDVYLWLEQTVSSNDPRTVDQKS